MPNRPKTSMVPPLKEPSILYGPPEPFRIIQGTPASRIARVIEESLVEYHSTVARALPEAKWHDDDRLFWMATGVPYSFYNGVFRSSLNNVDVDAVIESVQAEFERRNLPFMWQIGPSSTPTDLSQHLLDHGFVHDETEPGMALNIMTMNENLPAPADIKIETVRTEIGMDHWIQTWACGAPRSFIPICKAIHGRLSLGEGSPWQYFIGMIRNEPVATALLFLGERTAVVHWIATLPQVRRKGIGTAITLAVLREARARGYSTAVLTASDDGATIYRRIGFKEYCKISKYKGSDRV